ncbi:MAG TPA: hypothetical protein VIM58_09020 [Candidatus Methylacidiphilales bacterium]
MTPLSLPKRTGALALILALTLLRAGAAPEEKNVPRPPLPPGPAIRTDVPDYARWTVDFAYSDRAQQGEASRAEDASVRPLHIDVSRTGTVQHEERTLEKGLSEELWTFGNIQVRRTPTASGLIPAAVLGLGSPYPELDWVAAETYAGPQGKNLLFKRDVYSAEGVFVGTMSATVDAETRYPVSYQFLSESRRYAFLAPPTEALAVPAECATAGKQMMERIQKATPHLGAP